MKRLLGCAALAATMLAGAPRASAFCGFYVNGAGSEMFADATQVVLMRMGTRTVLSMQNAYQGPLDEPHQLVKGAGGSQFLNVYQIAAELHRSTKEGGVVVWIVMDQTVKGSETGNSFRQALAFKRCGWRLHDTMIYHRVSPFPDSTRYHPSFEYRFVFSKGRPATFNPIEDRPNRTAGAPVAGSERQRDGRMKPHGRRNRVKPQGRPDA